MPHSKLSDLLPIDASVTEPNAYQVFGLKPGESDSAKVSQAIRQVIENLDALKADADPEVWKRAAKLAGNARKLLRDPERRIALDESLKASGMTDSANDPLAALLPSGNPTASQQTVEPATTSSAAAVLGIPAGSSSQPGTPPLTSPTVGAVSPVTAQSSAKIDWAPPKQKTKRRKKSNSGAFVLGLFVVVMLGAIFGLLYYLNSGNKIQVGGTDANDPGGVKVSEPIDPQPAPANPDPPDGVLGQVASSGISDNIRNPNTAETDSGMGSGLSSVNPLDAMGSGNPSPPSPVSPPDMADDQKASDDMMPMTPDPPMPSPSEPVPTPDDANEPPTPAMVQENQKKIDEVEQLIAAANWSQMKSAANALLELKLSPEQFKRASSLYDIADLATYYRGGIERGLATLSTGNTFEIVKDLPVIVVEVAPNALSIQANKKTWTYTLDELPPRLTEKLAAFAIEQERPDSIAGLALYRLIHPSTNEEYRADAFEQLASVDGQLEKVDTESLQQVAKELLSK